MNLYIFYRFVQAWVKAGCEILFIRPRTEMPVMMYLPTERNIKIKKVLARVFTPSIWAPGPWSQSIFSMCFHPRSKHGYSHRDLLQYKDGCISYLDWKGQTDLAPSVPIMIICHGVAGDLHSTFCIQMSDAAYQSGMRAVVYNRRGHAGAPIIPVYPGTDPLKGYPIHADAEDLDQVCKYVKSIYPDAPILLAGTSAGANLVLRYLGEYIGQHPCRAAFVVASPFELYEMSHLLRTSLPPQSDAILTMCLQMMWKERLPFIQTMCKRFNLTVPYTYSCTNTAEMDMLTTLPFYKDKYYDLQDYYEMNSSASVLHQINVPTLVLNALDDPLVHSSLIRYSRHAASINSNIFSLTTEQGGHSGWLTGSCNIRGWHVALGMDYFKNELDNA